MATIIEPLFDRILILPENQKEEVSASGIVLSSGDKKEKPVQGTVVAVGPGRVEDGKNIPVAVSVGDTVLFSRYGYEDVSADGTDYVIIQEANILAVIK